MDEDTTQCSFLKRAFPPGLKDEVSIIEANAARTAGTSTLLISYCAMTVLIFVLCQVK